MQRKAYTRYFMLVLASTLLFGGLTVQAAWYNPFSWGKGKKKEKVETYEYLIVTSNFVRSRMLAELIQYQARYPVLLLPTGEEKDEMFALGPDGKAVAVHRKNYVDFVRTLQPKTVVFLGNQSYVPDSYVKELEERFPTVVFRHDDWDSISKAAGDMLRLPKLHSDYLKLQKRLDGKGDPMPDVNPASVWRTPESAVPNATDDRR